MRFFLEIITPAMARTPITARIAATGVDDDPSETALPVASGAAGASSVGAAGSSTTTGSSLTTFTTSFPMIK